MNARIPQSAIIGAGVVTAGAAVFSTSRARMGYLIFGTVVVAGALVWNRYIEDRLIAKVVADGMGYPAPLSEAEQNAR